GEAAVLAVYRGEEAEQLTTAGSTAHNATGKDRTMSDEPTGCTYCKATTARRTGQPFDRAGRAMHELRCPKRPSATVAATVETATVARTTICAGGKSTKSTTPTVPAPLPLSFSREE